MPSIKMELRSIFQRIPVPFPPEVAAQHVVSIGKAVGWSLAGRCLQCVALRGFVTHSVLHWSFLVL